MNVYRYQAKARETVYYKMTKYAKGKPGESGTCSFSIPKATDALRVASA